MRGIPLRWRSIIRDWDPPHRFVNKHLIGPYRRWIHEHRFEDLGDRTRAVDHVRYAAWSGKLVERVLTWSASSITARVGWGR